MDEFFQSNYPEIDVDGVIFLQIGRVEDMPTRRGKNIFFDDEMQTAVFRIDGTFYAVSNICPHQHAPVIFEGYIEELTITCPLHGWIYSLENGKALGGNTRLRTYRIFEKDGLVYLEKPRPIVPNWNMDC